jgi:hypothetical protein
LKEFIDQVSCWVKRNIPKHRVRGRGLPERDYAFAGPAAGVTPWWPRSNTVLPL